MSYEWQLDARLVHGLAAHAARRRRGAQLLIERTGDASWLVDGVGRPDLDGCEEVDLSVTPFCNTLALKRLAGEGELTTLYVSFPGLTLQPSRQRYERLATRTFSIQTWAPPKASRRSLEVDANGIVTRYEGLFEQLPDAL